MLDGSIRCHWLARSGIFLPSVSQVVLRNLVVSQSICEKVRPLRSAEMGKLGAANFKLRHCLFADPDAAARKLVEIANASEAVQDGRILIELINAPSLNAGGAPAEYRAGVDRAIAKGWLWRYESGVYVKFTSVGAELFV